MHARHLPASLAYVPRFNTEPATLPASSMDCLSSQPKLAFCHEAGQQDASRLQTSCMTTTAALCRPLHVAIRGRHAVCHSTETPARNGTVAGHANLSVEEQARASSQVGMV